jgi:hypothetical protein
MVFVTLDTRRGQRRDIQPFAEATEWLKTIYNSARSYPVQQGRNGPVNK